MDTAAMPSQETYDSAVEKILDQPGYQHLRLPWADFIENFRENIEGWVIWALERLFDQAAVSTPISGGLSVAVIILSAAALIGLVLLAASLMTGVFRPSPQVRGILGEPVTAETTPESLMARSQASESAGDIRQAMRLGFIALLLKMHRSRLVFLDETWTNQELYLYLEKSRFASLHALKELMDGFNASWYGHKPFGPAAYSLWQTALEQVWQEVESREI